MVPCSAASRAWDFFFSDQDIALVYHAADHPLIRASGLSRATRVEMPNRRSSSPIDRPRAAQEPPGLALVDVGQRHRRLDEARERRAVGELLERCAAPGRLDQMVVGPLELHPRSFSTTP